MSEISQSLQIALAAASLAQETILAAVRKGIHVEIKSDLTPVTEADRAAEEAVKEFLAKETPDFGFIGEEYGRTQPEAEYQWILDPIDGTKAFARGVPLYGTLLALWKGGEPIVGLIRLPALNQCLWASKGGGAWVDGVPARVSSVSELSSSLVLSGTVNTVETMGQGTAFHKLRHAANLYRGWGDCYGYFLVATGKAEIMLDPIVSLWDIAPFPIIFSEAGGSFSFLDGTLPICGGPAVPSSSGPFTALASNGKLHSAAVKIFSE